MLNKLKNVKYMPNNEDNRIKTLLIYYEELCKQYGATH